MNRKYAKWAMVAALALTTMGVLAYAQAAHQHKEGGAWGGGMPGMMGGRMMHHIARYLDLTDAQKTQIKAMIEAEKPKFLPLAQQLANGRKQMLALTANGAFDQAKIQALATQQSQTLAQLIVMKEQLQSEIYNKVLTQEQRTKADQLRQKQSEHIDRWLQHLASPAAAPVSSSGSPAKPSE